MKPERARKSSSSSTRLRKTTERNRVTDSHILWLKSLPSRLTKLLRQSGSCKGRSSCRSESGNRGTEKKPSLKSMKKAELIEFAKENNIEIDEKATNAVMIETIEAALK